MNDKTYQLIQHSKRALAVLIDPDKCGDEEKLKSFLGSCAYAQVDFIFVGGSLLTGTQFEDCVNIIRSNSSIPLIIFPGSNNQISSKADAILLLSLISGRNPEYLIGQHITAAPALKKSGIEILSTGYLLIDCGNVTTAAYISNTLPIPYSKPEIAATTALAGEQLGMKLIYLDGGSGAAKPISSACIKMVRENVSVPLITGGGMRSLRDAEQAWDAGTTIVVIGTAFENNPELILEFKNRKRVNV